MDTLKNELSPVVFGRWTTNLETFEAKVVSANQYSALEPASKNNKYKITKKEIMGLYTILLFILIMIRLTLRNYFLENKIITEKEKEPQKPAALRSEHFPEIMHSSVH